MDPLTMIVTAVVLGASDGLKVAANAAVRDGYAALKSLLAERFSAVDVSALERKPDSEAKRRSLAEDLTEAGADVDKDIAATAEALIRTVEKEAPETAEVAGVRLADLKARNIVLEDIVSSGHGVVITKADVTEDLTIKGVRAGHAGGEPGKS